MGFTTACFIRKNTPELRSKLKELGYDICCCTEFKDSCWLNTLLLDKEHSVHGIGYINEAEPLPLEKRLQCFLEDNARSEHPNIDCGTNEELFLALAALRDDDDYMQWFVSQAEEDSPKVFIKSTTRSCTQSLAYTHRWDWRCSKATVEEIIEHFKK
jgi:hypothetical protein